MIGSRFVCVSNDMNPSEFVVIAHLDLQLVICPFHLLDMDGTNSIRFQQLRLADERIPLLFPFDDRDLHGATGPMVAESIGSGLEAFDFDEASVHANFVRVVCGNNSAAILDEADTRKVLVVWTEFLRSLFRPVGSIPNRFDGLSA